MEQAEFEQQVDKYLSGRLGRDEIETLWAEMVKDPSRLEYVKTVANTREVIKNMKEEAANKGSRRSGTTRYIKYAVAASIALIIGVLSIYQWEGPQKTNVQPIEAIELNYYRGDNSDAITGPKDVNQVINEAITMANSGSTDQAIELLQSKKQNLEKPKSVALLSLNIGSLLYNAGQFEQAISSFQQVVEHKEHIDVLTLEKAYWFLGNSYFQQGETVAARKAIRKAYELDGAYRRVAGTYLNAMANK